MEESKDFHKEQRGRGKPHRGHIGGRDARDGRTARGGKGGPTEQPHTHQPRRNNNRGGHGQGGKPFDKEFDKKDAQDYRPQTAQPNKHHKKQYQNYRHQRPEHSARNRPINASKDSYYYKYYYGPYPEIKEIEVTLELEIPNIKEADRLQPPSEEEYAKRMRECDDEIQVLRTKISTINDEKKQKTSNRRQERDGQVVETKGKNFKQLVDEKKSLQSERRGHEETIEKCNSQMAKINEDLRKINKFVDKSCPTLADVDKEIKKIEYKLTTETIPPQKEKEMFKHQKFLEKSKPYYETFEKLNAKMAKLKEQHFEARGKSIELGKKIKEYNTILDEMNEEFKSKKELQDKHSEELQKLEDKIQVVKTEIGKLFEKKNEIREQHYKEKFNYEAQLEELAYYDYLKVQQGYLIAEEKERLKQEAEVKRKEEEKLERKKNMPNPYEEEIKSIGYLITQLRLKKRDYESMVARAESEAIRRQEEAERRKEIEKQQAEGRILIVQNKKAGNQFNKNKKKGKNQKGKTDQPAASNEEEKVSTTANPPKVKFDFKYDVVKGLVELNLDVPSSSVEEIDKVIEKLYTIKTNLEDKGKIEIDKIFASENWQEAEEKLLKNGEDNFLLVEEEEEHRKEKKNVKPKSQQKPYKIDDEDPTLGGHDQNAEEE
mmetsp:Transcript_40525/g.46480  ORF Transcript_40525/g.46480 Transcript_40525/m.46480 type:complete len:659 (-) Transcript_40525:48-2024(-)